MPRKRRRGHHNSVQSTGQRLRREREKKQNAASRSFLWNETNEDVEVTNIADGEPIVQATTIPADVKCTITSDQRQPDTQNDSVSSRRMGYSYCAVYGCHNNSNMAECKQKGISFHFFPQWDRKLVELWCLRIGRPHFLPGKCSKVCSEHFTEEDFIYRLPNNQRQLKEGSVPSHLVINAGSAKLDGEKAKSSKPTGSTMDFGTPTKTFEDLQDGSMFMLSGHDAADMEDELAAERITNNSFSSMKGTEGSANQDEPELPLQTEESLEDDLLSECGDISPESRIKMALYIKEHKMRVQFMQEEHQLRLRSLEMEMELLALKKENVLMKRKTLEDAQNSSTVNALNSPNLPILNSSSLSMLNSSNVPFLNSSNLSRIINQTPTRFTSPQDQRVILVPVSGPLKQQLEYLTAKNK